MKGLFIPEITTEMFRTGCLESIEALMAEGEIYDIEYEPKRKTERKTGWIPCSERLPEEHIGFYLVTIQKKRITALNVVGCDNAVHDIDIARWDYDRRAPQRGYHWCKADKVIAWMPLPEPYKEEGNG